MRLFSSDIRDQLIIVSTVSKVKRPVHSTKQIIINDLTFGQDLLKAQVST